MQWTSDNDILPGTPRAATPIEDNFNAIKNILNGNIEADNVAAGTLTNTEIASDAAIAYSKLNLTNNIVNADIDDAAAIDYSKLDLAGHIVNADVATGAAIEYSKLNLTNNIVNADIDDAAAIDYSKLDLTGHIANADVASGAAIDYSKLHLTGHITTSDLDTASFSYVTNYVGGIKASAYTFATALANNGTATFGQVSGTIPNVSGNLLVAQCTADALQGVSSGNVSAIFQRSANGTDWTDMDVAPVPYGTAGRHIQWALTDSVDSGNFSGTCYFRVKLTNLTGGSINLNSGSYCVLVFLYKGV